MEENGQAVEEREEFQGFSFVEVAEAMKGGGSLFAANLAVAMRSASAKDREKLLDCFPELVGEFAAKLKQEGIPPIFLRPDI